jgi:hyperosmotically inducible protein
MQRSGRGRLTVTVAGRVACDYGVLPVRWVEFAGTIGVGRPNRGRIGDTKSATMKTSFKPLALVALFTASLAFVAFNAGCASTATRESTGEYVDDSTVTIKVKAAFVKDPIVKASEVTVETFKGVVQLSGFVNTAAEKIQAGRVAANVKGVTEVKNSIVVK